MVRLRCVGWNCESFARQLGFCGPFAGSLARQLGFHGEFGGSLARELGFHGLFAGSLAPELTFMVSLLEVSRGGSIQEGLHPRLRFMVHLYFLWGPTWSVSRVFLSLGLFWVVC